MFFLSLCPLSSVFTVSVRYSKRKWALWQSWSELYRIIIPLEKKISWALRPFFMHAWASFRPMRQGVTQVQVTSYLIQWDLAKLMIRHGPLVSVVTYLWVGCDHENVHYIDQPLVVRILYIVWNDVIEALVKERGCSIFRVTLNLLRTCPYDLREWKVSCTGIGPCVHIPSLIRVKYCTWNMAWWCRINCITQSDSAL